MLTIELVPPHGKVTFRDEVYGFLRRGRRAPPHVHRCPRCYGVEACGMDCVIEPDLALDNGTPCASFEVCSACVRREPVRIAGNASILGRWADDGGAVPDPDPLAFMVAPSDP